MQGLAGKTVIVTGGATLLGAGVVQVLRQQGAQVAVFDIDAAGGARTAAAHAEGVRLWPVDITDDAATARAVAEAASAVGPAGAPPALHGLVNLACTYTDGGDQATRADWQQALNVNVVSAVMLANAVRPHLQRQGGGAIVNFTSISAKVAQTGRWLY
ncbi:MAG: short-chain dehydrogenase, partial [Burkholderiales bacterium PBB5]